MFFGRDAGQKLDYNKNKKAGHGGEPEAGHGGEPEAGHGGDAGAHHLGERVAARIVQDLEKEDNSNEDKHVYN